MKEVKVGIIGFGTVGAGVAANILGNSDVIAKRANVKLVLSRIADLDITTDRGVKIPEGVLTTDAAEAIREADIVVELVGGTTVAKKFILDAIQAGKPGRHREPRRCWRCTARKSSPPPKKPVWTSITKRASRAASRSSRRCAKGWSPTASAAFTAS